MAAYLQGDQRAFRVVFERYGSALRRYFLRHGKATQDVADLVQQTFLQLHRARDMFRDGEALRPWLYTIARNVRFDHSRRRQRRPETFCDLERQPCSEPATDVLLQEQRGRMLAQALEELPRAQRQLIDEHWLKERSWTEIAARHGSHAGTLRVRAHRTCLQLREQLALAA